MGNENKALDILINKIMSACESRIKKYKADHTFKTTIWKVNDDGTYQINYLGQTYNVPSAVGSLKLGQQVWLKIPNGIFREMHIYGTTESIGGGESSHTHSNLSVLEIITLALINKWNEAFEKAHAHTNKDSLDTITPEKIESWDNKSEFDGDYNSLTNKPTIPSINGLASEEYVDDKISELELGDKNTQSDWNITDTTSDAYIKNKPTSMPASDVYDWAKAEHKPNYTYDEVGASKSDHTHDDRYYTESEVDTKLNAKLNISLKGSVNGIAELDSNGKVPTSQLPSYVDDVLEYNAKSNFPTTGETGKIYIDISANKSYRWSGSTYIEISTSLALGETSSTAYRGDRGKIAYDHSQSAHAPSNAERNVIVGVQKNGTDLTVNSTTRKVNITVPTKTSEITNDSGYLTSHQDISGKLDKTGDASNVTNTFTSATSRTNLTTGEKLSVSLGKIMKWFTDLKTVAFSGSYNDLSNKPTIPTVGNGTITITQNGTTKGTFTTNQNGNATIDLEDTDTTYTSLKNPYALTIQGNGTTLTNGTYDGSSAKTVNITPSAIGAAESSHGTHVSYSTTAPVMDGTASVGTATTVSRSDHKHPSDTSRVPTTRTVNGKALSSNITLSASDIKADDGNTLESKVGAINGITDSLVSSNSNIALSAKAGNTLYLNTLDKLSKTGGTMEGNITFNGSYGVIWENSNAFIHSNTVQELTLAASAEKDYHLNLGVIDNMWTFSPATSYNVDLGTPEHYWGDIYANHLYGSADSASKLSAPINMTIGSSKKVVDGSANVEWSLSEIGAAPTTHEHSQLVNGTYRLVMQGDGNLVVYNGDIPIWSSFGS